MQAIVTIQSAREQGLRHYFTGEPCKHGHIAPRFTGTRICMECNRINTRKNMKDPIMKLRADLASRPTANERYRRWYQKNKKKALANTRRQQAARLKRVPIWSEKELIEEFYMNCPEGYQVDHIIPLQGKFVSGLHVLANLQYLPALENQQKGNQF